MIKKNTSIIQTLRLVILLMVFIPVYPGNGQAQTRKKVEILHCDQLLFNERIVANAQRLLGNVNITVDGALMWCDSLYSYTNNMVDAFGNVHIIRGDTLNMYADFINYNGDTKLARARRNVRLIDKKVTLTTDSLDYNMNNDLAAYNYSGTVVDSTNVLKSVIGQYYVNEKKAYFKTRVDGVTKDYKIKSDTLIYFTDTKKVYIEGPTHIFNEKDTLYAEYGWYDSMKNYARLTKKPRIWNVDQKVKADSILYDKENGEGLAMGHARIQDFKNSIIVTGNRVQYNDLTKIASATDSAVLIQYSKTDSLYLHADLLQTMPDTTSSKKQSPLNTNFSKNIKYAIPDSVRERIERQKDLSQKPSAEDSLALANSLKTDSLSQKTPVIEPLMSDSVAMAAIPEDSMKKDTIAGNKNARLVLAYHHVRFYRKDFQGKCDSLAYWSKDSTIQFYTDPVLWSDKNQITARYIEMINKSKDPDEVHLNDDAFIIALEDDSLRFNQIKGKNMIGYIRKNQLSKIDVLGNGQSNYYAKNEDGLIGLNKAESSDITIYMNEGKVKKIVFVKSPEGELKPMGEIQTTDKFLPGFLWQEEIRPKSKEDIFSTPVSVGSVASPPKVPDAPVEKSE
jgi:lipopolysaccharide export system protein LptA